MNIRQFLKKLDERFISMENRYLRKVYMFLRQFSAMPFRRRSKTNITPADDNIRVVRTMDELDEILSSLDAAQSVSDDELRKLFPTFHMEFNTPIPMDPYSDEYAKAQFDLYQRIAGKKYSVENEKSEFDVDTAAVRPFPYFTGSCETVGNHLAAIAHVVRSLNLKPGSRIVEFGPGWGNTTLILAMMGFDVTAVDIEKNFCELINKRAEQAGVKIRVVNADFSWIEQIPEPVDAILFFESFHHSSDHLRVIQALDKAVRDDGKVYFAAEPIIKTFPIPWGLRLDGESLWAIRKKGWLELGFSQQYFLHTLRKFNWAAEEITTSLPWGTIYEATKQEKYSRTFLASDPLIRTQIGVKSKDGTIVSDGSTGYLVYGPYISLPASEYVARLMFSDTASLVGKGRIEIACSDGAVILESQEVDFKDLVGSGKIQIKFEIPRKESDVEIRLFCYKGTIAKVNAIELEEMIGILIEENENNGISRYSVNPNSVPLLRSCACSQSALESDEFQVWVDSVVKGSWPDREGDRHWMHRKVWEWCYICQVLYERGLLKPDVRGLGFAVGKEPLSAIFASHGCNITATDLNTEKVSAESGWIETNQHAANLKDLNKSLLCPEDVFQQRVSFRFADMNHIDTDLTGFDFLWSSCSLEHLGSLQRGKEFVYNSLRCLKPGGIAVHTTEFNISSNEKTLENKNIAIFRRRDLEEIARTLQADGHQIELDFTMGEGPSDLQVDTPPYKHDVHLRLEIGGYICTSYGLIIQKALK